MYLCFRSIGTFLNGTLNSCVPCKKGTYQPNSQQTSCIPCPPNTSTKGISSTSKSDCWNPCEMGASEIHCDKNAHCLLIPETSDFKCECKPGFNGTGKYCVGEFQQMVRTYSNLSITEQNFKLNFIRRFMRGLLRKQRNLCQRYSRKSELSMCRIIYRYSLRR